mmetsp:Transcript_12930/g.30480  ORF Transcript_12930/g.30480 Transcript_12930/m.30480 type:complete len:301 (+) Transcript_12930:96-998(+)
MDEDIGNELSALLGQLQTQKQQVDGLLNRKGTSVNHEASYEVASRSPRSPSTQEHAEMEQYTEGLVKPRSVDVLRSPPPPSTRTESAQRKHGPSVLNTPSVRLANGDRFDFEDLYDMLPSLEWDKLFKQVEIAAQEKGKKPKQTAELNSMEDQIAVLKHQVSSSDMQAQDMQTREVKLHADMRDREERLQKVAGSTLLACLDLQNSLERIASLHMSGQKIQGPNGPVIQLRMPVENECLKELDACRSKIKHLELTASNAAATDGGAADVSVSSAGVTSSMVPDPLSDASRTPPSHRRGGW